MTQASLEAVNRALSGVRAGAQGVRPLAADDDLGAGLSLHSDPALGLAGRVRSPEGWLLELELRPAGVAGFCGLHLELPPLDLTGCAALGFVARGAVTDRAVVTAALRSGQMDPGQRDEGQRDPGQADQGRDGGFTDAFFDRHLLLRPEEVAHVDALPLPLRPAVPARAPWRQLVLFLPPESLDLSLIDLRVFAV